MALVITTQKIILVIDECMYRRCFLFLLFPLLVSCAKEKKRPVYVDVSDIEEEQVDSSSISENNDKTGSDDVVVPFREKNGVKYVKVSVNGVGFDMIFDTGCSSTLLSIAEAKYLYEKGKLSDEDILGTANAQVADGSIVENMVVNLKEVVIDDQIACPNVQAVVSANINAPLLLGNEVLNRLATITIDNDNQTLNFKLKTNNE